MANITNVNELWGRKWRFKDDTPSPSEFSLRNSVTGVKFATFYLGEEVKDVYQTDNSVGNVGITTQGTFIRIGVSESSFTYAYAASGWVGKPAILEFIDNTENYTLSCTNEENFITWFNENATEYVPPLSEWTKGVADAIREKKGTSDLIKPLDFAKEISSIEVGGGESEGDMLQQLVNAKGNADYLFYNFKGTDLSFVAKLDISNATSSKYMFGSCQWITTIPKINTKNITDMSYMFYNCSSITTIPQLDTSNVNNMEYMFAGSQQLTEIPQMDTSKVTRMTYTFQNCSSITTIPQLDTSNVTGMSYLFKYCYELTTIPLLNTSNVTGMNEMFSECTKLTTIPQLNTSNVTNMSSMFYNCRQLTTIPQLNTSKATSMSNMFYNCFNLTTIIQLDMTKVTNTSSMFSSCRNLTNLSLLNIKVNLIVGAGTSYGHLLTVDSLIGLCKECVKQSSSRKLTVGTANLEKLANVYVKFTDSTQTTIDTGTKGDVIVCESTDEGAMLISDYMTLKSWTLAS